MDAFTSSAQFYEVLTNAAARLAREGPFLLQCLERAPGRRVLDLACGTGLHALFFAEHGASVTALDVSTEMIAHAGRRRPHPNIVYAASDMRAFEGGPWDLVVCLGNSLSLVDTLDGLTSVYASVHRALSPGGLFLTQTLNYELADLEPKHRVERARVDDMDVVAVKSLVPQGNSTLLSLSFFASHDGHGTAVAETAVLRHWTRDILCQAAQQARLTVEDVLGGYDGHPFAPLHSPDLLLLARKGSFQETSTNTEAT